MKVGEACWQGHGLCAGMAETDDLVTRPYRQDHKLDIPLQTLLRSAGLKAKSRVTSLVVAVEISRMAYSTQKARD